VFCDECKKWWFGFLFAQTRPSVDPISAQRTELDLRLLAHKMLAVETLWIKARLLTPELSYKYPSLNGLHSAILDTSTLANEFT
jgi:hypothetical protein